MEQKALINNHKPILKWDFEILEKNFEVPQEDFIEYTKINGTPLVEILTKKRIRLVGRSLRINVKNLFGDLIVETNEQKDVYRIVPSKLFKTIKPNSEDLIFAYDKIKNIVFGEIRDFLTLVVRKMNQIQTLEQFKAVQKEFIQTYDFMVYLLEDYTLRLEKILLKLFLKGPIHKEILYSVKYYGNKISFTSSNVIKPYKEFYKREHTLETPLNIMLFQTLFYIISFANILSTLNGIKQDLFLEKKIHQIIYKANDLLNKYNLWCFSNIEMLNDFTLINKILTQSNPEYKKIFRIYRQIKEIIFSKILLTYIDAVIKMPIRPFEAIYEIWTIAKIFNTAVNKNFKLEKIFVKQYEKRKAKIVFQLVKEKYKQIIIIWELKFKAVMDSLYFSPLIKFNATKNRKKTLVIKPDLLILLDMPNIRKAYIGDIKFSKSKYFELPKLRDLYKVVAYLNDLKDSKLLKNYSVEGLLIYPGFIKGNIRIPVPLDSTFNANNKNQHITVVPFNIDIQNFGFLFKDN